MAEISDYAITKILNNPNLTTDEKLAETKKWAEGGIYRIALHTITAALAIGTIEGAISAGTTAYAIPKIDEYLTKQGYTKQVRDTTLLALSATLGTTIGDSTASTVNNVGQTRWNYLTHRQLQEKIACYGTAKDCADRVAKYDKISKEQDERLKAVCSSNPNGTDCQRMMKDALEYVGENRNHYGKASDIQDSTKRVLNIANSTGYHTIDTLTERANYFGAMYGYTGQPWFRVAESESRNWLSLKGADKTFYSDWIAEAGAVIMKNGKKEFQDIYKNHQNKTLSWSYWRLVNEQNDPELQRVHEKYYNSWNFMSQLLVDSAIRARIWSWPGRFLNPKHRIRIGCAKMQEVKECR
ncbi:DUF6862 domain-containing protein [Moraxella cuniculi]|uniref:DUF6862 domain-containing protein n=1 Tax=Moraxella cuniculi TaxID=34061 RepID=A0A3S4SZ75_9GAMM|nr:hypothetical protein [Moraxella cuniculi]VEG13179.1 Uncharacterised protein [Moraxella cuniculi]